MKISFVIPCFNSAKFIDKCIESIANNASDSKVYVIDNCSVDETLNLLINKKDPFSRVSILSQADAGPANAINLGFQKIKTEIIGWLNSDDYYADGAIERVLLAFENNPNLKMIYGYGVHVDDHGNIIDQYPTLPPKTNINQFANGSFICQPTVFFRSEVLNEVGYLDESLKTAFDLDFWLRIFKTYKRNQIGFVDEIQAYSRLHDECLTRRLRHVVAVESMQVICKHLGYAPKHWVLTYFDEICEKYPFIEEGQSLVEVIKSVLTQVKSYMKLNEFEGLVKTLQNDYRLRLSNQEIFLSVEPDGWVSKRLVVKHRSFTQGSRLINITCKGGWPLEANLNLTIKSMSGDVQKVKLQSQDEFNLSFVAECTSSKAFNVWIVETRQCFIPLEHLKKSKDNRQLSFKVEGVSIQ
jgi:glycosyltransferase involved in cell wall biosynthesis